jgi:hypothetical protein
MENKEMFSKEEMILSNELPFDKTYGAFTLDVLKSVLNENLGGILDGNRRK